MNEKRGDHRRRPGTLRSLPAALLLAALAATGCSTQQAYHSAQAWQRKACSRALDAQERDRCMAAASLSYDDYRRRTEALTGGR